MPSVRDPYGRGEGRPSEHSQAGAGLQILQATVIPTVFAILPIIPVLHEKRTATKVHTQPRPKGPKAREAWADCGEPQNT